MVRHIPAAIVLALGMVVAHAADDKKATEATTPSEMLWELRTKFGDAESKEQRDELLVTYRKKFFAYAEKHQDENGAEALFNILQMPGKDDKGSPKAKALALLKKDHAKTTKLDKVLKKIHSKLSPEHAAIHTILAAIAEENADKPTRAYAYRALMKLSEQAVSFAERVKDDEELKEKLEKQRGKEVIKRVLDLAASSKKDLEAYKAKLDGDLKGILLDLSVGKAAPEVRSLDLAGKKVKLSDLKGKVVVLDFWATWCGPCKKMIPHTRELVKKMDGKPFVFVSVSADEKKSTLETFLEKTPMPWTHWYSGTGGVVDDWEIDVFPTIYILDTKGVIRAKIEGADNKAIEEEVKKLLEEGK